MANIELEQIHDQLPADTLADADKVTFLKSALSKFRSITWANLKLALKTFFDNLYAARLLTFKSTQITTNYTIIADDVTKECVINTPTDIDITVGSGIPIGGSVFFRIVGAGLPVFVGTASQDITVPDLADRTFIELYRQEDDTVSGNEKYEVV